MPLTWTRGQAGDFDFGAGFRFVLLIALALIGVGRYLVGLCTKQDVSFDCRCVVG